MGLTITPALIQSTFWGFSTLFQSVSEETPVHWPEIASEIPSDSEEEVHAWLKRQPELTEWVGERRLNELSANAYGIPNKLFQDGFKVPRTKIEDDKLGIYAQGIRDLALAAKIWPDRMTTDALTSGESWLAHDGQPIFSASHPVNADNPASATQSNLWTGGGSTPAKPLSFQAVSDVRANGESLLAENGVPMELEFGTIIVPPQLKTPALQIANGEKVNPSATFGAEGTGGSQDNVLRGTLKVVVLPRLASDPTTWYLACTNRAVKPLIYQNRVSPEFQYLNKPEDPNVFQRDEYVFGVRARGAAAFGPWFLIQKCKAT